MSQKRKLSTRKYLHMGVVYNKTHVYNKMERYFKRVAKDAVESDDVDEMLPNPYGEL